MPESLRLRFLEQGTAMFESPLAEPLELGRQRQDELAHDLYALLPSTSRGPARLLVARQSEGNVSRQHVLLEPLASGKVRVTNQSKIPLPCPEEDRPLSAGENAELDPPFSLLLPPRTVVVDNGESVDDEGFQALDQASVGPSHLAGLSTGFGPPPPISPTNARTLIAWLHGTMTVLEAAIGSADFLEQATRALLQIASVDSGRVLLLDGEAWITAAAHGLGITDAEWRPSQHVLDRLRREKRPFVKQPRQTQPTASPSLTLVSTVVAAPILDGHNRVIGALYGERRSDGPANRNSISKLELMLVDLLALGVGTGLARQEQEKAALKATALFEQFFTRQLAQTLARQPDLLDGRAADVAVLFCDVRGFSSASERLGPAKTFHWINDVMGELSACVQAEEGVLVDYIGDELMAMWGVPEPQPDQAARAARASLAMLDALAPLNQRWHAELGKDMAIGIGVNSGLAQVGNTGSRFKFKYGPLGNTVNLASRVQGLTKYLRCRFLVTRPTREQLGKDFIARRVVRARVVNIEEPVDLYEVERTNTPERAAFFRAAEAALDALEARDFAAAARAAGELLPQHRGDGALLLTLSRASAALMNDGADFDPVWVPPGK